MTQTKPPLSIPIEANIDRFTGRTWLLQPLLDWLARGEQRLFLLTGGPGTGKSMISAWLAGAGKMPEEPEARLQLEQLRAQVKAVHFCIAASGSTDPKELARQMADQLTSSVPGFGQALAATMGDQVQIAAEQHVGRVETGGSVTGVYIANLNLGNLSEELSFNRILRDPLKRLYEDGYKEPMILLVDALDEALTYKGGTNIVQLLAKLADLPSQVRILATTRPDPRVLMLFSKAQSFDLIKNAPQDVDDVKQYILEQLPAKNGLDDEQRTQLATQLSQASKGIFLYAYIVLGDLLPRLPQIPDLETYPLPDGLSGLYNDFLNRELGQDDDRWYESFKPVLGLIAVAQGEGLTQTQLRAISRKDVEQPLRKCKQYLAGELPDGPFRVFHKSFADFLLEDEDNVHRHIDASAMHGQIADYYWTAHRTDWTGCEDYGLRSLAIHCGGARQFDHLRELMSAQWMAARFEGSGCTYDGFVADVMIAWARAYEEAHQQIRDGEVPQSLADCIRFALITTSTNSLAANYVPTLVGRAVETGLWSAERGLSVAARVPYSGQSAFNYTGIVNGIVLHGVSRRAAMFAALLKTRKLSIIQHAYAQEAGLAAVAALSNEGLGVQALAFAELAPQLTGDAREQAVKEGLAAVQSLSGYDSYSAHVLAALAPLLTGSQLQEGLKTAQAIGNERDRLQALAALARHLGDEVREQVLQQGELTSSPDALIALAPIMPVEMLHEIWARERTSSSDMGLVRLVVALAPHAEGIEREEILKEGMAKARHISYDPHRALAMAILAPFLSQEARQEALAEALAMVLAVPLVEDGLHADALASLVALAPMLSGELLERALAAAQVVNSGRFLVQALVNLAPHLTGEAKSQAIEIAWDATEGRTFPDETSQAMILEACASELDEEMLWRAWEWSVTENLSRDKFRVLTALVSQMIGEAKLKQALAAAREINNEYLLARVLKILAPRLTGLLLQQALEIAQGLGDKGSRTLALAAVAPYLGGDARKETFHLALAAVPTVRSPSHQVEVLATLIPYLADDGQMVAVQHAWDAALSIGERTYDSEWTQGEALAALAPYATDGLLQTVTSLLTSSLEWERIALLTALAAYLPAELLEQELERARTTGNEQLLMAMLTAMMPRLTGDLLKHGQAIARGFLSKRYQTRALSMLAPISQDKASFLGEVRQGINDSLRFDLRDGKRLDVLKFCADATLFAPPVLDRDTLAAIAGYIVEICTQWQWP